VRRLSRDLPTFDSVWIDALVQLRKLTPFQARLLEQGSGDELLMGGFVVINELGHGPHGTTRLARTARRNERVVLKQIKTSAELLPECQTRLAQLIERAQGWSHPNVVIPHALFSETESTLVTVGRWVPGLTLADLLIRRGRLPAGVVLEIARQLATGLSALHGSGLVHGDLRLSNVRLTSRGIAVLVDGGVRPAVCPELTIHETLALDAYDSVAPELIGTGIGAHAGSEIYALGCLLWQLLTGRPPYSMADPLMKLAAHQTQRIADVRTLAPETPTELAESIHAMTSPDENQRPRSFEDLLHRWGRPGLSSRSLVKRYRKTFDGGVPHFDQASERRRTSDSHWPWVAVSLFIAAGMALTFADQGMRTEILAISRRVANAIQSRPTTETASDLSPTASGPDSTRGIASRLLPLPPASADGTIILAEEGPYDVARVAVGGHLTIQGAPGVNPVIQVGDESIWLSGSVVKLENLTIDCARLPGQAPKAMVLIQSNQLIIQGCVFRRRSEQVQEESSDANGTTASHSAILNAERRAGVAGPNCTVVGWAPLETASANVEQRRLEVSDSVFRADGSAFWFSAMPHQLTLTNCLKLGDGACIAVSPKASTRPCQFDLRQLTLRNSGSLLRLAGAYAEQPDAATIQITAHDCVFAPAPTSPGLIELHTARPRSDAAQSVRMRGSGSVLIPNVNLMVAVDSTTSGLSGTTNPVAGADEQFEGIVVSDLSFAGPETDSVTSSRLENLTAPRTSVDARPGIDISRLPTIRLH
jgi:serine/threonine-protein kinase